MRTLSAAFRTMPAAVSLVLLLAVAGCGGEDAPESPDAPAVEAAPAATAPADPPEVVSVTANALKEEIREMDAEIVVLNVWATWCGPCRVEFPEFVRYGQDVADEEVAVRFLSVDDPYELPRVQQFLVANGAQGRTYLSGEGTEIVADLAAPNRWTYGIPVTLIFGSDGEVVDYWEGAVNYDFLQAKVKQALEATSQT